MFYISRYIGDGFYGVVDTDDGSEEQVTKNDILYYCDSLGFEIKGVKTDRYFDRRWRTRILEIKPYQDESMMTLSQTKLKVMNGVQINIWQGVITSVAVSDGYDGMAKVRLSRYGTACGDYIFKNSKSVWGNKVMTVILDDKLDENRVGENTFTGFCDKGIVLDARELHSKKILNSITKDILRSYNGFWRVTQGYVLAEDAQLDKMKALVLMERGAQSNNKFSNINDVVKDPVKVNAYVYMKYGTDILKYIEDGWRLIPDKDAASFATFLMSIDDAVLESKDYKSYISHGFSEVFDIVRVNTPYTRVQDLSYFIRYIQYFDVHPTIQKAFVDMTYSVLKQLLEVIKSPGWWWR